MHPPIWALVERVARRDITASCSIEVYREIAYLVDESAEGGFTLEELIERAQIPTPCTQAAVALAFMKERGCVVTRYRRTFPASSFAYEDAMIEFHALREKVDADGRSADPPLDT